jgi:hypothetical protein
MKKKIVKKIVILIIVLTFLLIVLLFIDFIGIEHIKGLYAKPKLYDLPDECGIITGKLIHNIRNDAECKIKCNNECTLRNLIFYDIKFIENNTACNHCKCYCK